jgi:biopolymer transport protein ExbD
MSLNNNHRDAAEREVELPTFIDMIFLLLIFFIATLTLSTTGEKKPVPSDQQKEFNLPKATGRVVQGEEVHLTNLLFQIENLVQKDSSTSKVLYVLWPDEQNKKTEMELYAEIEKNLKAELPDSTYFAVFPENYLDMSYRQQEESRAFALIKDMIRAYHSERLAYSSSKLANTIEIRATRETEFRIINYIMQQCSLFEDDIPKVTFRVMAADQEPGEES